jgi:DedD protein
MANNQQDTEITLGTGRMLALFFALVVICAVFFSIGFSLGRKANYLGSGNVMAAQAGTPTSVIRPSAGKNNPPPTPASSDFSFYNAVGQKTADSKLAASTDTQKPASDQTSAQGTATDTPKTDEPPTSGATNAYFVQVAAVTRQEDADALVEALKRKQYPAFANNNPSVDKYFRVQVGPYADIKDAEGTRNRLISDGYNPILRR